MGHLAAYSQQESAVWLNAAVTQIWCPLYNNYSRAVAMTLYCENDDISSNKEMFNIMQVPDDVSWMFWYVRKKLCKEVQDIYKSWLGCIMLNEFHLTSFALPQQPPSIDNILALRRLADDPASSWAVVMNVTCANEIRLTFDGTLSVGQLPLNIECRIRSVHAKVYGRYTRPMRAWSATLLEYPQFDLDLSIRVAGRPVPYFVAKLLEDYLIPYKIRHSMVVPFAKMGYADMPVPTVNSVESHISDREKLAKSAALKESLKESEAQSPKLSTMSMARGASIMSRMSSYKDQIKDQLKNSGVMQKAKAKVSGQKSVHDPSVSLEAVAENSPAAIVPTQGEIGSPNLPVTQQNQNAPVIVRAERSLSEPPLPPLPTLPIVPPLAERAKSMHESPVVESDEEIVQDSTQDLNSDARPFTHDSHDQQKSDVSDVDTFILNSDVKVATSDDHLNEDDGVVTTENEEFSDTIYSSTESIRDVSEAASPGLPSREIHIVSHVDE